ncbi:MAG TPA: trehalose-6-phosphate synthase [Patescibacteria group bacterium]|nr:trehalose-6-phosphate synthase [Patescibacteria group bacterium]
MSTRIDLGQFVKRHLKDRVFVVVSNREPYVHTKTPEGVKLAKPAGGAHTLLDAIAQSSHGVYVAHAGGDADHKMVDAHSRLRVPPGNPTYTLKRVFLSKKEVEKYYYGFSNQALWPLCHAVFVKPVFDPSWWEYYKQVNEKFAQAILEEIGSEKAFIWVNDYHFSLLPELLQKSGRDIKIGTFWHIPWPTYEIFRVNPWSKSILTGLLGSDFLSFHRGYHAQNFFQCIQREIEAQNDEEHSVITYREHRTKVAPLPAGIDYYEILAAKDTYKLPARQLLKRDFGVEAEYLAIGVDRLDYTKGLIERFTMIDRFLEKYPDFVGKFVYFGILAPSRTHIAAYRHYAKAVTDVAEKVNWKYMKNSWRPIHLANKLISRDKVLSYYRAADCCLVTSLDDGMNLVAKEYVLSCESDRGMLVLSRFAGASKDLRHSILINPYNIEEGADAIYKSLTMKKEEKKERNSKIRAELKVKNIYQWAIDFIAETVSD